MMFKASKKEKEKLDVVRLAKGKGRREALGTVGVGGGVEKPQNTYL